MGQAKFQNLKCLKEYGILFIEKNLLRNLSKRQKEPSRNFRVLLTHTTLSKFNDETSYHRMGNADIGTQFYYIIQKACWCLHLVKKVPATKNDLISV